jgi:hypothetical protein
MKKIMKYAKTCLYVVLSIYALATQWREEKKFTYCITMLELIFFFFDLSVSNSHVEYMGRINFLYYEKKDTVNFGTLSHGQNNHKFSLTIK